jgi:phosphotransferase system  glucose/maltose/N-acetylglucosamine-specific IIC component
MHLFCFLKSLFVAFMRIFSVQVIARNIAGFPDIPAPAIAAMDCLSFSAFALIPIGAVFALISARVRCKTANEFDTVRKKFRLLM